MAKLIYLSRRSVRIWHHLSYFTPTMSCQETKKLKRKTRDDNRRKDSFIAEYVRIKYPHIYSETIKYHGKLREFFPNKTDLTKTDHFKKWRGETKPQLPTEIVPTPRQQTYTKQTEKLTLNMELNILLMNVAAPPSTQVPVPVSEPITEEIYPSLLEGLSQESVDHIIKELQQYPDLRNFFTELDSEHEVEENLEVGAEIEIEDDTRLENELL